MRAFDGAATGQVGDGAGHAQDAVHRACGQLQAFHRLFEHGLVGGGQHAIAQGLSRVEAGVGGTGALQLAGTCLRYAGLHGGAVFGGRSIAAQFGRWQPWHLQLQVDAVQQRAGDACAVAGDRVGRAAAAATAVASPATWARVHRRHQLEAGRELGAARGPRDGDHARFQRLAQHFERLPLPFGH